MRLLLKEEEDYRDWYNEHFCTKPLKINNLEVSFPIGSFNHAFYWRDRYKSEFDLDRAELMYNIDKVLLNPIEIRIQKKNILFFGYIDNDLEPLHLVVIGLHDKNKGYFVTSFKATLPYFNNIIHTSKEIKNGTNFAN